MPDQALNDDITFRCDRCNEELSKTSIYISASLFGVIFLFGEQDGYFGITCPNEDCNSTILTKYNAANIFDLKKQLFFDYGEMFPDRTDPRFKYHSFPYSFDSDPNIKNAIAKHAKYSIGSGEHEIDQDENLLEHETGFYRTFDFSDHAIGPAISILWFHSNDIEQVQKYENQTGRRAFPRYIVCDPLYSAIDDFCWENHLIMDFYEGLNLPFELIDMREPLPKRKILANIHFLEILDKKHPEEILKDLPFDNPSADVLENPPLENVPVNPLDTPSFQTIITQMPPQAFSRAMALKFGKEPWLTPHYTKQKLSENIPLHDLVHKKVWDNFNKDYVQDLLSQMSIGFIDKYIELSQKTHFNFDAVWNLKESYLKMLFDSINNRSKREQAKRETAADVERVVREAEKKFPNVPIISKDPLINNYKIDIVKYAPLKGDLAFDFLIIGETGVGKELFAQAIHEASGRNETGELIPIDCGAISDHLFESEFFGYKKGSHDTANKDHVGFFGQANNGTLFLDEIGNLSLLFQQKFLRVLQEKEFTPIGGNKTRVDVKVVCATNADLEKMVQEGTFRADLLARINGFTIEIPPLRKRKKDVRLLAIYLKDLYDLDRKNNPDLDPIQFDEECLKIMEQYPWPNNVRELQSVVKRILASRMGSMTGGSNRSPITADDLPARLFETGKADKSAKNKIQHLSGNTQFTDKQIIEVMEANGHNKSKAAKILDCSWNTIDRRWKKIKSTTQND